MDYDQLNPGIRRTVQTLHLLGYTTTDSGDGKTHEHACDRDHPYVVVSGWTNSLGGARNLEVSDADKIYEALESYGVEMSAQGMGADGWSVPPSMQFSYDPGNRIALIDIMGVDDTMLGPKIPQTLLGRLELKLHLIEGGQYEALRSRFIGGNVSSALLCAHGPGSTEVHSVKELDSLYKMLLLVCDRDTAKKHITGGIRF